MRWAASAGSRGGARGQQGLVRVAGAERAVGADLGMRKTTLQHMIPTGRVHSVVPIERSTSLSPTDVAL